MNFTDTCIEGDTLKGLHVQYAETDAVTPHFELNPKFIVISSTQTATLNDALDEQEINKTSAHILIDRNGEMHQQCCFKEKAWHAGASYWQGYYGLNSFSIGISLVNYGSIREPGRIDTGDKLPNEINGGDAWVGIDGRYWHRFGVWQFAALDVLLPLLVKKYNIRDIVRHSDVAPGKETPGPLFPISRYKRLVDLGNSDSGGRYVVVSKNNTSVLGGPDVRFDPVGKVAQGATVKVLRAEGSWRMVVPVPDRANPTPDDSQGWVHESVLRRL